MAEIWPARGVLRLAGWSLVESGKHRRLKIYANRSLP